MSHSYVFTYPGVGHGAYLSDPCASGMVLAFLANPVQRPDASCIATMKEPTFFVGPA